MNVCTPTVSMSTLTVMVNTFLKKLTVSSGTDDKCAAQACLLKGKTNHDYL